MQKLVNVPKISRDDDASRESDRQMEQLIINSRESVSKKQIACVLSSMVSFKRQLRVLKIMGIPLQNLSHGPKENKTVESCLLNRIFIAKYFSRETTSNS